MRLNTNSTIIVKGKINGKFYVYELWNPINKNPFYVGKGKDSRYISHVRDAIKQKGRNLHKINTIKKIISNNKKVIVKIIFCSDIESACIKCEVNTIKKYGRRDNKTGILTNMTDGGDGVSGFKASDELRKRQSEMRSGSKNIMFNRKHSKESCIKMGATRKRKIKAGEIIIGKHSEEWKKHLRENNPSAKEVDDDLIIKLHSEGKSVLQIEKMTGITARIIYKRFEKYKLIGNNKQRKKVLDNKEIHKLAMFGFRYKDIADFLGNVSQSVVGKHYREYKYYIPELMKRSYNK